LSLSGPSARPFAKQPGRLYRFIDGVLVSTSRRPRSYPIELEVELAKSPEPQTVSFNWRSDFGAVAANSIRVAYEHPDRRVPRPAGAGR
jgi:hypothetical protein